MLPSHHDRIAILLNPHASIRAPALSLIRAVSTTTTALHQEIRLLHLPRRYSCTALNAACSHLLHHGTSLTPDTLKPVLQRSLDQLVLQHSAPHSPVSHNLESPIPHEIKLQ